VFLIALSAVAQTPDPAYEPLTKAFEALRGRDYDSAIALFQKAAKVAADRADIRKNLAYTLLKTGETDLAREEFGEASRLEPGDFHVALEYAFLCFEARDEAPARRAEARRIFLRVRENGDPESRATATAAFQNIDEPLAAGIARWQQVLASSAPTFSAHYELAQLAEQRDELELASTHYRAAFQMLPERKSVLLELARVLTTRGDSEGAMAALLAASRGGESRVAELAKERMPARYPFVYEFRKALELDPKNSTLHRELAYLLLSMSEGGSSPKEDSLREFEALVAAGPEDYLAIAQLGLLYLEANREDAAMPLLQKVLEHGDSAVANRVRMALKMPLLLEERDGDGEQADPRIMGERSYASGFLKDALRYFTEAREENPVDGAIALKLGWTNNLLHDDRTALHWFDVARQSADKAVASEAEKAWENLRPGLRRIQTTVWIYPLFSSRWNDAFGYGQAKTALRLDRAPWLRPYVSVRYAGDVRRNTGGVAPQNLSESAFIFAVGVATTARHGVVAWGEAGRAVAYVGDAKWADYRGGVSWSSIHRRKGWFLENGADSVFISHFQNDWISYSQNRLGRSVKLRDFHADAFLGASLTFDAKRQYWANFTEIGPGLRFRPKGFPNAASVTLSAVRGVYLINEGNPRRPNFTDIRVGVWYAFSR
jgi:Tfp pilus assembly protein PilF